MSANAFPIAKFRLGHIVSTPHALEVLPNEDILTGIARHQAGDWGDVDEHDRQENEFSLQQPKSAKAKPTTASKPPPTTEVPASLPTAISEPTPTEVPIPTDSGKESVVAMPSRPEPPRDLGRGGEQHKAIQKRIKQAAEELGFRSVIEKSVLDGQGSVDLWLERTGEAIACEISLSTTVDHEVGNVNKCLKAGIPSVAVICLDEDRLWKIAKAVEGSLGKDMAAKVAYYQPDPFIAHLRALQPPMPQPSETTHDGYKVKRSIPKLSPQEQRQREDIANRIIGEAMRRKK